MAAPYSNRTDGPPGCRHGTMFEPPWPKGYGYESERADATSSSPSGGLKSPLFNYEMVDQVHVPRETGAYVLSFRWDTVSRAACDRVPLLRVYASGSFLCSACVWFCRTTGAERASLERLRRHRDRVRATVVRCSIAKVNLHVCRVHRLLLCVFYKCMLESF